MENFNKVKKMMSLLMIPELCDQDVTSMMNKMKELKPKEFKVAFDEMEKYLDIVGVFALENRDVHKVLQTSEEVLDFKYER